MGNIIKKIKRFMYFADNILEIHSSWMDKYHHAEDTSLLQYQCRATPGAVCGVRRGEDPVPRHGLRLRDPQLPPRPGAGGRDLLPGRENQTGLPGTDEDQDVQ